MLHIAESDADVVYARRIGREESAFKRLLATGFYAMMGRLARVPYQGQAGWFQVGGTSLSAPLIGAVYALAGNAGTASYPASIPYANTSSLHDVTSGSNGSCGTIMCQATAGYDGPTGVGTPNGTGGF